MSIRALLVADASLSPQCAVDPNVELQRQLLLTAYGVRAVDICILSRPGLRAAEVMQAVEDWLVPGCRAGDVRLIAVTAHGGMQTGRDGHPEQSFGFTGDHAVITASQLEQALAPVEAAGAQAWTVFEICAGGAALPPGFLPRFEAKKRRTIDLMKQKGSGALKAWQHSRQLERGQWSGRVVPPDPVQVFPSSTLKSLSLRGCTPPLTCAYYEEWGGVFTQNFVMIAREAPRHRADDIIVLTWLAMLDDTRSQVPILTGPPERLARPLFT